MNENELKALVEQRKAELAAAQELVYKAEQAEREAKREAERQLRAAQAEEERKAQWAYLLPIAQKVVDALKAAGLTEARVDESTEESWVPDISVTSGDRGYHPYSVKLEATYGQHSRYSFRHVKPEGWRIVVGSHGGQGYGVARYPVKADGTFNSAKMTSTVKERLSAERAENERKAKRAFRAVTNKALTEQLKREFGKENTFSRGTYDLYGLEVSIYPSEYAEDSVAVHMSWAGKSLNESQARRLLALLTEFKAEDEQARLARKGE